MFGRKFDGWLSVLLLIGLVFVAGTLARAQSAAVTPVESAALPQTLSGWHLLHGDKGKAEATAAILRLAPEAGTNLFHAPGGGYNVTNAPIVYTLPEGDFLLTAKVEARLEAIYDVAALVVYADDDHWAKLCFENSALREATIVSVVTRGRSDDNNSETIASPFVYLAIARRGNEFSFHFSRDGKQWRLARDFAMEFAPGVKLGFAAHTRANPQFSVAFSEMALRTAAPKNMRQLEPEDLATR